LQHIGKLDKYIWEEFHKDWESLAFESQQSLARLIGKTEEDYALDVSLLEPDIPTEARKIT